MAKLRKEEPLPGFELLPEGLGKAVAQGLWSQDLESLELLVEQARECYELETSSQQYQAREAWTTHVHSAGEGGPTGLTSGLSG